MASMGTDKIRIQPLLDSDVHKRLDEMAKENGAKISPYAASVLTKHVQKKEMDKPFTPKKEYGK